MAIINSKKGMIHQLKNFVSKSVFENHKLYQFISKPYKLFTAQY